ncbi:retrovirus-related pol polyprotein from transposon TNT 1-94 [Tanacetum coccineum]
MTNSHQQSIGDAGSKNHPPMLEKGSYVPLASHFMRYIDREKAFGKMLKDSITNDPYKMKKMNDPWNLTDIYAMNFILLGIPNDIYNSVDACKTANAMWNRVEYDLLYDFLKQNEVNVNASKAKRAAKAHDPLILIANTYASPSQSRSSPTFYVRHPHSMVANDSDVEPSYDSYFVDESVNSNNVKQDNNAHDQQPVELESLLRNVQIEYANTQRVSVEVKKANELLAKELETYKEQVQFFENKPENKSFNNIESVNTKFDKPAVQEQLLCVTTFNKFSVQKGKLVPKTVEKQVLTKLVTLQTLPQKKNVNASCDSCDVMYVSCAKSVFDNCHDKCVAKYVNSVKHKARRALCTSPLAAKTRFVDASPIAPRASLVVITHVNAKDKASSSRSKSLEFLKVSTPNIAALSLVCLMSKASSTKSWLWHRLLSHLNFTTINQLAKQDMVVGLPKFKYEKDHLCSACKQGKSKRVILKPKPVTSIDARLQLLPMDLSPEMFKKFITRIQVSLCAIVCYVRTDNGTDFKNEMLMSFYEKLGITHQKSIARIPQQNGVVERRNRTLVEAARTMLIFSNSPDFLWAEAFATACFIQNRSLIHTRFQNTPYELIR